LSAFVAIDLGASSCRVVNVHVEPDGVRLDLVRRFPTPTRSLSDDQPAWDVASLLGELHVGLREATSRAEVESVAIDAWGVDYGLLDHAGRMLGPVHAYRSTRTAGVMEQLTAEVGRARIYDITGIQFLPFNTIYQLAAARETPDYLAAGSFLMIPDLLNHLLCGSRSNEITNASTTQLLDIDQRRWSNELIAAVGLRPDIFPTLHQPGTTLGPITDVGPTVDGLNLVAAASHDTASAVAGTPLRSDRPAVYISCGTWALVGCELATPVTSSSALQANVTNELGAENTVRLLKNVTGLWLLEECRRRWAQQGMTLEAADLVAAAEHVPAGRSVVDPDDPRFATAGDMPGRIAAACRAAGQPAPATPAEFTRTILDSLALKLRTALQTIEIAAGIEAAVIHLVGGGAAIPLLSRLCASACERPVLAGPVEATVTGNALVQAVAAGALGDIEQGRRLVERTMRIQTVHPERINDWSELGSRLSSGAAHD
jgi:rhamnulokinase